MEKLRGILHYLGKWVPIALSIGVVSGVGAWLFINMIRLATQLFLGHIAGYVPPSPLGTSSATVVTPILRKWLIPVSTTLGGLISGYIVFKLAPEAEGHGTDAAIDAFHNKAGAIRARVPLIKMVASAITMGSGGSAGREGPTAQIAAGFGSVIGYLLKLDAHDRRIALATGIGAGVGAIFKAPLGGAILSAELLYLNGMEMDALVPSLIAATVGYVVFTHFFGYTPVFGWHLTTSTIFQPVSLLYYAILGLFCGVIGILYSTVFYKARDLFKKLPGPKLVRPALGGLMVGLIGVYLPQSIGIGYGWIQVVMDNPAAIPLGIIALLIFAKIVTTSLSIGSGGSGGVFAPGLFIGSMVGALLWAIMKILALPGVPAGPELFMAVGMVALFGGVARAPLAMILMIAEMTGSYAVLLPAMLSVGLAYLIVGEHTIYRSQLPSPADSPAHVHDYLTCILKHPEARERIAREFLNQQ